MLKAMRTSSRRRSSRGCLVLGWCPHADVRAVARKLYGSRRPLNSPEDVPCSPTRTGPSRTFRRRTTGPRRSARRPRPSASSARRAFVLRTPGAAAEHAGARRRRSLHLTAGREKLRCRRHRSRHRPTRGGSRTITREAENVGFLKAGALPQVPRVGSLGPGVFFRFFGSASALHPHFLDGACDKLAFAVLLSLPFELHFIAHSPSRRAPRLGPVQRRRAERQHAAHIDAEANG